MRTVVGWAISAAGLAVAIAGTAVMVMLGPDSRVVTGPHAVDVDGSVVVTAPRVIRWVDTRVDVLVEVPANKPVFVGLGNTVDVDSLVDGVERLEVTEFETPWDPTTRLVDGQSTVRAAPTALDWWIADAAGLGGASISTRLPDQPVSLAIVSVGASNLSGLQVTLAYGMQGGFGIGVGALLLGLGGVLVGVIVRRSRSADDALDELVEVQEEVVYVVVDDDGSERELTPDEVAAGGFLIEEEVPAPPEEVVRPDEPGPSDAVAPPAVPVTYVFVDEDGVEHEVGEDELDQFEIVEDDTTSDEDGPR